MKTKLGNGPGYVHCKLTFTNSGEVSHESRTTDTTVAVELNPQPPTGGGDISWQTTPAESAQKGRFCIKTITYLKF